MTGGNSPLRRSLAGLFGAQGFGYAISLVQVPLLTRALDPEGFGVYGFANVLILVLTNLIGYAANSSGVLLFRRHARSPLRRSLVFWNQFSAQCVLALAACGALVMALLLVPRLSAHADAYALLLPFALANALYCPWVFSAMERFATVSRLSVFIRLLGLVMVVLFVHDRTDIANAVASVVLPNLLVALLFGWTMWHGRVLCWVPPRHWRWRHVLVRDFFVAMSTYAIVFQANAAILIARFTLSAHDYGLLAFADRFRVIAQMVIGTIGLVLFSRYCRERSRAAPAAIRFGRRAAVALIATGGGIALAMILLGKPLVALLGGPAFADARAPMLWIAATMPVVGVNYYLTYFVLNLFGMARWQLAGLITISLGLLTLISQPPFRSPTAVGQLMLGIEIARALLACAIIRLSGHKLLRPGERLRPAAA